MPSYQIDHGDVVEVRYTILTTRHDPNVVVLVPSAYDDVVEHENVYFLRCHKDGQLCDGHIHDWLNDARACTDRTKLNALWQDLARIMADAQLRLNAEYADYRKNDGTLGGGAWLAQRDQERRRPERPSRQEGV